MKTFPGCRFILAPFFIVAVLFSECVWAEKPANANVKKDPPPSTGVKVAEVQKKTIREEIEIVGSVESPRVSMMGSEVEGIVKQVFVEEGDEVRKGQPLIELSNSQLRISLAEAEAEKKEAEALWEKAVKEFGRYDKLFKEKVVDEQLVTNSQLEAERGQAAVEVKKAKVSLLKDRIKKTTIYSPFDGIVAEKSVEKGAWVKEGEQVFRVFQIKPVWITLPVPEKVVGQISLGTEVEVELDAFPDRFLKAKVIRIIPEANQGSRTYPVRLLLDNKDNRLKIGMMVRGIIPYGEKRKALLIPQDAITVTQGRKNVYVVDKNNKAKLVYVDTGILRKGFIEVKGDLLPGDKVVTRGGERLRPGMALRIINPGVVQIYSGKESENK